jgi:hypothetical protein
MYSSTVGLKPVIYLIEEVNKIASNKEMFY